MMTVAELKAILAELPDDMPVAYNYDSENAFPVFKRAYVLQAGKSEDDFVISRLPDGTRFLCLDESLGACKCNMQEARPPHPCPLKHDLDGDSATLCTCCATCEGVCADGI